MTRQERLQVINDQLLPLFEPELRLELRSSGRLWLVCEHARRDGTVYRAAAAAVLDASGRTLGIRYGHLGMGGTSATAVAQLVRWLRGQTRLPVATWAYWCGPSVSLAGEQDPELLARLRATDYDDPAKTCCVLCGNPRIGDWWSLDGVQGPCCWGAVGGRCPEVADR